MIRFIIETTSSNPDVYGNRYHFATVTSTRTGKGLRLKSVGGDKNAPALVRKHTDADWSELHYSQAQVPIREFKQARKRHEHGDLAKYEHETTAQDFEELER